MQNNATTNLDQLIEAERKRAAEKIAKLKRAAAAEQRRVDEKVIDLLREQDADLYEQLAGEARGALEREKAKRSSRAKKQASSASAVPAQHASRDDEHGGEVRGSWQ